VIKGLVSAIRTLTIFPLPGMEPAKRYTALPWFAVVGGIIGTVQFGCAEGMRLLPSSLALMSGLLCVIVNYVVTGGLHLDGFADTADAFGTRHDKERTLAILKDPHIGSFGVAGLVVIILWRVLVYQQLFTLRAAYWLIPAIVFSRIMQGLLLTWFPYSRGLSGKASGLKGTPLIAVILLIQLSSFLAVQSYFFEPGITLITIACGLLIIIPLITISMNRINGITGDIVGASTEAFECAYLTGVIACLH
jgi:adenosylcobinamide-GDP ribazoletransferase